MSEVMNESEWVILAKMHMPTVIAQESQQCNVEQHKQERNNQY